MADRSDAATSGERKSRDPGNPGFWWEQLTPLQRVIVAVLRAAMAERVKQREAKRLYEEAIYGRP